MLAMLLYDARSSSSVTGLGACTFHPNRLDMGKSAAAVRGTVQPRMQGPDAGEHGNVGQLRPVPTSQRNSWPFREQNHPIQLYSASSSLVEYS